MQIPSYVIYGVTGILGVLNHYVIPQLRKEMPWLLCSKPLLKPKDWDSFEVTGTSHPHTTHTLTSSHTHTLTHITEDPKLSVLEQLLQLSLFLEKNVFYPLTFLFAFNLSAHHYKIVFGEL